MNTVIWVMMIYGGQTWMPTLEFTTEQKCVAAAAKFDQARNDRAMLGTVSKTWCMSIEK